MQPLVSIITVTRNLIDAGRKDFFRQCVESVRMQDYPNVEHLIIDGASTDGTVDLLKEMNVNYISEPDKGISDAYNKGIRLAKGKYIAFLNSDDFYTRPDSVSLSVNALEEKRADFSYACFDVVSANREILASIKPNWKSFFCAQPFGHPTMFSSKQMLEELNGFDETFKITGDFDLIMRAVLSGKRSVFINEKIVSFRDGGISGTQKKILKNERIRVMQKNCNLSHKQAVRAVKHGFLPRKKLLFLLSKTVDFPDREGLLKNNFKKFVKFIRRLLFTLHLRKGKRCFRLLGITFYNEVKE